MTFNDNSGGDNITMMNNDIKYARSTEIHLNRTTYSMKRCKTANMNNIVNTVRKKHLILNLEQIWSWNPHCCDRLLWKLALVYASRVHLCHKMKSVIHLPEGCNYYNAFWKEGYWIWAWRINTRYHGHTFTIFMCFQLLERRSIKSISKNL